MPPLSINRRKVKSTVKTFTEVGDLTMSIREKLLEIVGSGNFSDDPSVLNKYAADFSLTPAGAPSYMVKPKDAQEVPKGGEGVSFIVINQSSL
jgi:hypothetical protein